MADIDIQEKRGQPAWVWIAGIVALLAVVGAIWALTGNRDDRDDTRMRQDTVPTRETPTGAVDRLDDVIAAYVVFSGKPAQA